MLNISMLICFILTIALILTLLTTYFPAIPSSWRNNSEPLGPYTYFCSLETVPQKLYLLIF